MPPEKVDPTKPRSFLKMLMDRRWKKLVAGIVICIIAALILIPYGIRYSAKRLILASGGDDAQIADVDFNPFTGRVALTGVNINVGGEQYLRIGDAEVLLRWWPLIKKRIRIKRVWINDTEMTIETLSEGKYRLGGIIATLLKASQEEGEEKESSPWGVGAREITVENTRVKLRMPDFKSTVHVNRWAIRQAFSWQPEKTVDVEFDGKIDDSPLNISGEVTPFAKDRLVKANLKLERLKTDDFNSLLKAAGIKISGRASVEADLKMLQKEDGSFSIDHNGRFRLEKVGLVTSDLKATAGDFSYDGILKASLPSNKKVPVKVDADGQMIVSGLVAEVGEDKFKEDILSWKGIIAATVEPSEKKMNAVLDGSLGSQKLTANLTDADLNLEQSGFNWKGKIQASQTANDVGIDLEGNLTVKAVKTISEAFDFAHEEFSWDGQVSLVLPKNSGEATVTADGKLAGGRLDFAMPAEKIKSRFGTVEWLGNTSYVANEKGPRIDFDGHLTVNALGFESPDAAAAEEKLALTGKVNVELPQGDKPLALLLDGKIDLGKLNVQLPANRLKIDQDRFSWEGPLVFGDLSQSVQQPSGEGMATIGNLKIFDDTNRHLLLGASEISALAVQIIGSRGLRGSKLRINDMRFLSPQKEKTSALLAVESVTLDAFEVDPENKIEMTAIEIESLQSMLKREKDGRWSFSESLAAAQPPSEKTSSPSESKKSTRTNSAPHIRIGKLIIRGNSRIRFEDETVEPAVRTEMAIDTFELAELDSTRPDVESPFKLGAKIDKYTEIDSEGTLKPFDERLSMDLKGKVADLELPPFSPYIVNAIGYKFASGQADADLEMAIKLGQMDGETKFRFDQLRAKPVDPETLEKLGIKQTIPIETALSLLRDKDGAIKLKVPIKGDIADPQFSVGDAVNQALLKATTKASMTYLKYALGPYGIAIAAAEVAYMAATKGGGIRLEPVKFTAGTAEIDPADQGYVEKLASILKDRPEARIRVCGVAAQVSDQTALLTPVSAPEKKSSADKKPEKKVARSGGGSAADEAEEEAFASTATTAGSAVVQLPPEQLEALAKARSMAIKDVLVGQHGIKDDRILICHPEIDKTSDARPRAEILF